MSILQNITEVNAYIFDLNRYQYYAQELEVTFFGNYLGYTYMVDGIFIITNGYCDWDGTKWEFRRNNNIEVLKIHGAIKLEEKIIFDELSHL
jgi:hypothetical protein